MTGQGEDEAEDCQKLMGTGEADLGFLAQLRPLGEGSEEAKTQNSNTKVTRFRVLRK